MSRNYKFYDQSMPYFVSFSAVHWIDLFTRECYCLKLLESLTYCQNQKGLIVYSWCIMPSHIHLIIGTNKNPMQDILRDFKSYTSRTIRKQIKNSISESRKKWLLSLMRHAGETNSNNKDWQLWQQHNHPIELNTNKKIDQRLSYVHNNPVKAGYVSKPEYWRYSSAIDYIGDTGLLKVEIIE